MPNMQVLYPYYVKNHMKAMLHWQIIVTPEVKRLSQILYHYCKGIVSGCNLNFELNESMIKQLI